MIRTIDDEGAVPPDLAEAVREAAAATPGYAPDLDTVRRRARARRRRHAALTAGFAAVLVGTVSALIPLAARPDRTQAPAGDAEQAPVADAPPPPPVQRLLLSGITEVMQAGSGPKIGISDPGGTLEVLPDGRLRRHRIPGMDGVFSVVEAPGGRLVALGHKDLMPHVQRDDGPWIEGVAFPLVVLRPDGSVALNRDVRVMGEHVRLIAADGREAYLLRPAGLVAHNLATGDERLLTPADRLGDLDGTRQPPLVIPDHARGLFRTGHINHNLDVAANRFAAVAGSSTCAISVRDTRTGALTAGRELVPPRCHLPDAMRLAPGGGLVAVVSTWFGDRQDPTEEIWLDVFDTATGAVRLHQLVARTGDTMISVVQGVAWSDAKTLRVAWASAPATKVHPLDEVLRVQSYRTT